MKKVSVKVREMETVTVKVTGLEEKNVLSKRGLCYGLGNLFSGDVIVWNMLNQKLKVGGTR